VKKATPYNNRPPQGISYSAASHDLFGRVVDAHAHADKKLSWQHTPEQLLSMMKECGIRKSVLAPYWDLPAAGDPDALGRFTSAIKEHRDKFFGFVRLNPLSSRAGELLSELAEEKAIQGLKLNPMTNAALPYAEPTTKLVRAAAEYGLPVLFHSGDDPLSIPFQIGRVAKMCPSAAIVMGHMGGYFYAEDAIAVARRHENVFLETSVMPYPSFIKLAAEKVGSEKVFFGSDAPGVHAGVEIDKILAAGLSKPQLESVLVSGFEEMLEGARGR
jgi:predicted TIM-barrel fold metal-dependent hydrolase